MDRSLTSQRGTTTFTLMRTILVFLTLLILTPVFGLMVIVAALFGVKDREGSIYDNAPRWWARCPVWAAGIRVRLHNEERCDGRRASREQSHQLVRRAHARGRTATLQVHRKGRAFPDSDLRSRRARRA
jgi:hypothetical protein